MDRYLLKNTIIIILVLVNAFLLGLIAMRQTDASSSRRQAEIQLVEIFAADDISLTQDAFSGKTPPPTLLLTRNIQQELDTATFFLGKSITSSDQGGGTHTYSSDIGVARFRANGTFDIVGELAASDLEAFCSSFCEEFSFSRPVFSLDADGTGTGTASSYHSKLPVFNSFVTFSVDRGVLLTVSGTLLPQEGTIVPDEEPSLSAVAALTAFQQMRRESGAVVSAVTDVYPGYMLQSTSASTWTLIPAWCIAADTVNYYVNCATGTVTS